MEIEDEPMCKMERESVRIIKSIHANECLLFVGKSKVIRPGDVVWFPPGEKHWHGATPNTAMTHIAIQEEMDGRTTDWLEHVTEEEYNGRQ